jgi:hypothetical protein
MWTNVQQNISRNTTFIFCSAAVTAATKRIQTKYCTFHTKAKLRKQANVFTVQALDIEPMPSTLTLQLYRNCWTKSVLLDIQILKHLLKHYISQTNCADMHNREVRT